MEHKKNRFVEEPCGKAKLLLAGALGTIGNFVLAVALLLTIGAAMHFAGIELFQHAFAELPSVPQASDSASILIHQQAPAGNSYYRSMSESLSVIASYGSGSSNLPSSYHRSMLESMSMTTLQGKAPISYSRSMAEQASFTTGLPPSGSNTPTFQPQRTSLTPYAASSSQRTDERLTPILKILGKRADTTARNVSGETQYLVTESISSMNTGSPDRFSEILDTSDQHGNPDDSRTSLRQLAAFNEYVSMQKSIQNAALVNTSVSSVFLLGAITIMVARQPAVSGRRMQRKMLTLLIEGVAHDGTVRDKNEIVPLNRVLLVVLVVFVFYSVVGAIDPSSGQAFAANLAVNKAQSGTLTLGTNPTDVTITSVDMSKAFAMCFSRTDSSNADRAVTCNLTSSTNLRVQAGIASATITVAWYVVEFKEGAFVQRGETAWAAGTASQNIAISSVDLSKTFVLINTRTTSTSQIIDEQRVTRAALTNSTNLQLTRAQTGIAVTHVWQVIQLEDTTVQSGTTTLSSVSSATASITPVDLSNTFLVFSTESAAATNGVEAQYYVRGRFTNTTQITFDRNSATNSATVSWFAVSVDRSTVQSGTNAAATTETIFDNTITAVTLSRASPFLSAKVGSTGTADQDSGLWMPTFTNTTNLRVQRTSAQSVPSGIAWFAVEWPSAAREMNDSLAVNDVIIKTSSYLLTEQLGASDEVARTGTLSRSAYEQLGVTDPIIKAVSKPLTEQLGVTDSIQRTIISARTMSEQLGMMESVTKVVSKSMSENLALTDPVDRTIVTSRSMSEQLVVSDNNSMARSAALSESLNTTDTTAAFVNFQRVVSDDLAVGDTVSSSSARIIVITDSMAIDDNFADIALLVYLDLAEPLVLSQSFTTNFTGFFDQVGSEGIVIGDNVTLTFDSIASQSELLALQDQIAVQQIKDVRRGDSSSEFTIPLTESLFVTSAMDTGAPIASEGKIIFKDIVDSLTLRDVQPQPLHQRVITIHDVTVAISNADIRSAATFGTAIATINFEIDNKGSTAEELMLRFWYSDPDGKTVYEAEQTITIGAGESIVEEVNIPFSSPDLYNVMIEVKSEDGTLSTTDIAVNVPWLTVYLYILIVIAIVVVVASIAYVIYAMRRSGQFIIGGK